MPEYLHYYFDIILGVWDDEGRATSLDSHGERRRKTKEGGSDFGIGGEDLWREPGMVSGL